MSNLYDNFHNLFPVSKTLRFELRPIGNTLENFEKNILKDDEDKALLFKKVKKYCDAYHKDFIDKCLNEFQNNKEINEFCELLQKIRETQDDDEIQYIEDALREIISKQFVNSLEYKGLFEKDIIKKYLKDKFKGNNEILKEIEVFEDFTTYFKGYNQNRENMYSNEKKHTAISCRLIHENLPIFINNINAFNKIQEAIPDIKNMLINSLGVNIENNFSDISNFSKTLTSSQIVDYNLAIQGIAEEGNKKNKGINEIVNEYNQKHKEQKLPRLKVLYKQILSDFDSKSFKFETVENDSQLIDLINNYYNDFENNILNNNEFFDALTNISKYDISKIYINNDTSFTRISNNVFGDWSYIINCLEFNYDKNFELSKRSNKVIKKDEKYLEKRNSELKKIHQLSLKELEQYIAIFNSENIEKHSLDEVYEYFKNSVIKLKQNIIESYDNCKTILKKQYSSVEKDLLKDKEKVSNIKNFLDNLKAMQELIKSFILKDKLIEIDNLFYNLLNYDEILVKIIPLYNKVRNYLTKKPYSKEKFKLNFNCSTLLDGWDVNKERDNLGVIFINNNEYYLGIINKKYNKIFTEVPECNANDQSYQKMEYKLLPGPNKMLPKVFFSKSRISEFNPSDELVENYRKGMHKKENFDLAFCHELIDFYKKSINKHEDWKNFDFKFKDTNQYNDINEFYYDVESQGYKITFKNISKEYIDNLVKDGKLFLFQIYNKDFSKFSKGKPNLHTMYFKALFDKDNLKDVIYKLSGEAEVFYRRKSIDVNMPTHAANKEIANKNPNCIKKTSIFNYDLIKDKRYTENKFLFYVSMAMNFKSKRIRKFNDFVNNEIKNHGIDDINIIGIDRGERHLLYMVVINSKGEIIDQCSLNVITNSYNNIEHTIDYHHLLDEKEKERDNSRKSWGTIENIKELKEGYMSQVVHKLVNLMIKYNAIVVLEDLNSGFKNSRKKVEKQVYDKFETALIEKLSYLVNKDIEDKFSQGGILNAYQLINSDIKDRMQKGVIFYIAPWCTSKIDPVTGFVNLFDTKKIDKEFVKKFDVIKYNREKDYFEFKFDYSKFTDKSFGSRKSWTLCSYKDRIRTFRNVNKNNSFDNVTIDLTQEFKKLFEKFNIDYNKYDNIKDNILSIDDRKFFNAENSINGYYGFCILFRLMIQLRNSVTGSFEDYIISPVMDKNGDFYDSRVQNQKLPKDADANGAFNIARKGLMLVNRIIHDEKKLAISNKEWLEYVQSFDK